MDEVKLTRTSKGYWIKQINLKTYSFGSDYEVAQIRVRALLRKLAAEKLSKETAVTVGYLVNHWLESATVRAKSGEIAEHTLRQYTLEGKRVIAHFGRQTPLDAVTAADFTAYRNELATQFRLATVKSCVTITRLIWRHAERNDMIAKVRFGEFSSPSRRAILKQRDADGKLVFTADDIRLLLDRTSGFPRAGIMLGLNCGYGPHDLALLTWAHFVEPDFIHFPRPKTGVERAAWLWPETLQALPPQEHDHVFVDRNGSEMSGGSLGKQTLRAMRALGLRQTAYGLRHHCISIMEQAGDPGAAKRVSGHSDDSVFGGYVHWTDRDRIERVCKYARDRILGLESDVINKASHLRIVG